MAPIDKSPAPPSDASPHPPPATPHGVGLQIPTLPPLGPDHPTAPAASPAQPPPAPPPHARLNRELKALLLGLGEQQEQEQQRQCQGQCQGQQGNTCHRRRCCRSALAGKGSGQEGSGGHKPADTAADAACGEHGGRGAAAEGAEVAVAMLLCTAGGKAYVVKREAEAGQGGTATGGAQGAGRVAVADSGRGVRVKREVGCAAGAPVAAAAAAAPAECRTVGTGDPAVNAAHAGSPVAGPCVQGGYTRVAAEGAAAGDLPCTQQAATAGTGGAAAGGSQQDAGEESRPRQGKRRVCRELSQLLFDQQLAGVGSGEATDGAGGAPRGTRRRQERQGTAVPGPERKHVQQQQRKEQQDYGVGSKRRARHASPSPGPDAGAPSAPEAEAAAVTPTRPGGQRVTLAQVAGGGDKEGDEDGGQSRGDVEGLWGTAAPKGATAGPVTTSHAAAISGRGNADAATVAESAGVGPVAGRVGVPAAPPPGKASVLSVSPSSPAAIAPPPAPSPLPPPPQPPTHPLGTCEASTIPSSTTPLSVTTSTTTTTAPFASAISAHNPNPINIAATPIPTATPAGKASVPFAPPSSPLPAPHPPTEPRGLPTTAITITSTVAAATAAPPTAATPAHIPTSVAAATIANTIPTSIHASPSDPAPVVASFPSTPAPVTVSPTAPVTATAAATATAAPPSADRPMGLQRRSTRRAHAPSRYGYEPGYDILRAEAQYGSGTCDDSSTAMEAGGAGYADDTLRASLHSHPAKRPRCASQPQGTDTITTSVCTTWSACCSTGLGGPVGEPGQAATAFGTCKPHRPVGHMGPPSPPVPPTPSKAEPRTPLQRRGTQKALGCAAAATACVRAAEHPSGAPAGQLAGGGDAGGDTHVAGDVGWAQVERILASVAAQRSSNAGEQQQQDHVQQQQQQSLAPGTPRAQRPGGVPPWTPGGGGGGGGGRSIALAAAVRVLAMEAPSLLANGASCT